MQTIVSDAIASWIPYKLFKQDELLYCRWLYTGDRRFTEPFFDETETVCLSYPENAGRHRAVGSLDILPEWSAAMDATEPSAFIFHVSRCGSTLIAQLLGMPEQHIVLAEVPFFDDLLRAHYRGQATDEGLANTLLPAAMRLYGQRRRGDESHLFIKTDSWHLCFYQQLRQLYPSVPFVLLYRSPDEVIRSQRRRRGMQSVPSIIEPAVFGFDAAIGGGLSLDDYMVSVLHCYFTIMLEVVQTDQPVLLVNYNEPIMDIMERVAQASQLTLSASYREQIVERSRYHAKYPDQVFQEPVEDDPLPQGLEPVMEMYRQLDQLRIANKEQAAFEPSQTR
ncbi:hypothetical protein [Paraflavitalea pollutisoli]|uniref:hypothetical protein n=1 Tax=Paraflavitalea pollutisoli TaxID=3034143 RepID=UPI0023EAF99E|nr:hypothetical protein [Paraflavitalea sp. H1-2-19X]